MKFSETHADNGFTSSVDDISMLLNWWYGTYTLVVWEKTDYDEDNLQTYCNCTDENVDRHH